MKAINGKKLCRLLESKGWLLKRLNGSHHIYTKVSLPFRVPVHGNVPLKKGLQGHLMKIAEIVMKKNYNMPNKASWRIVYGIG